MSLEKRFILKRYKDYGLALLGIMRKYSWCSTVPRLVESQYAEVDIG